MDKATRGNDEERLLIREAMQRIIEGHPIRSDGKPTIKSLAVEAGVKRWLLTHKHKDLQSEFHERLNCTNATPTYLRKLSDSNESSKNEISKLRERLRDLSEENHRMARIIQVLTLENENLRQKIKNHSSKVSHLRPT